MTTIPPIHPIEAESYRILSRRVDLSHVPAGPRAVVERVIHASADLEYAETMVVTERAVAEGVAAIRAGAPVITDVEMTRAGITAVAARCYLNEANDGNARTRSAGGMALAAARHRRGAVFVVGCAPTALEELIALSGAGRLAPALIIGLPVGFVGAADSKEAARESGLAVITNVGDKGGAAVAAAACNALVKLARG